MRSGWKSQARRILAPVVLVVAVLTPAWPGSRPPRRPPPRRPAARPTRRFSARSRSVTSPCSAAAAGSRRSPACRATSSCTTWAAPAAACGAPTDAGTTWTNISDGFFEAGTIGALAVAESNPNVIYAGTGSACPRGNISPGIGMYKSSDAGKTWQHIGLRNAGMIGRIQVHPFNPNLVYVAVARQSVRADARSAASIDRAMAARPGISSTPSTSERARSTSRWTATTRTS